MNPINGGKTPHDMTRTIEHCMRVLDRQASGPRVPVWMQATLVSAGLVFSGACREKTDSSPSASGPAAQESAESASPELPAYASPPTEKPEVPPEHGPDPTEGDPPDQDPAPAPEPVMPESGQPEPEKDKVPGKKTTSPLVIEMGYGTPGDMIPGPIGAYGAPPALRETPRVRDSRAVPAYGGPPMAMPEVPEGMSAQTPRLEIK